MTKRLVEIDDEKLEQVRAVLGAPTIKATVEGALDEVLALAARRRSLLAAEGIEGFEGFEGADLLADPEARRAAWG